MKESSSSGLRDPSDDQVIFILSEQLESLGPIGNCGNARPSARMTVLFSLEASCLEIEYFLSSVSHLGEFY